MLTYLLDTDIVIYTMKMKPEAVREAFNAHYDQLAISTITLMELIFGAHKSANSARNLREVEGLAARVEVLPYDFDAAAHTGQLRAELAKLGTPIGPYDQMIAGLARSRGLILVTNNVSEFSRVPGLRIENWTS